LKIYAWHRHHTLNLKEVTEMKTRYLMAIFFALVCLSGSVTFAAETLWVTSEKAQLKTDAKASSKTIMTVPIGVEVTVLGSKKRWHRIQIPSGKKGWMYRGRLSDTAPELAPEGESDDLFGTLASSDIKADEASTGRSMRGLSEETEEYAKNRKTPNATKKALDKVLAFKVSEKELQSFLKKGKIGEYAP
jgi:uncharacterized protein YgiM (DUF1202 family)